MAGVQIIGLSKGFVNPLFSDVNLNASGNLKIGLIGDNGSGKSTLLKMMAGREEILEGKVIWTKDAKIGYLEQEIVSDTFDVSGGEKKILKLTELFYGDYNVILLDEPDNHLDIEHKKWFEDLVSDYEGMVVVISHDRHFLESVVNTIWHLEEKAIKSYGYGYSKFKEIYEDNMSARQKLWENQEKERLRLKDLVARLKVKAASNDSFVGKYHSAEKRYEKWVEEMVEKPPRQEVVKMQTNTTTDNTKKTAIQLVEVRKTYDKKEVLKGVNLHLSCGEKIAINAPNGSGKSTLLNIISGRINQTHGLVKIGPNLVMGYYAQEHLQALDENETMIGELQKTKATFHFDAIAYLKKFLFKPEQIVSEVRFLSGGQKSRLQLAKFLAINPDILVLDEPTNHLDLKTVLALEIFLREYKGTLILVSHDQVLVNQVTDVIYDLTDGILKKRFSKAD